MFPTGMDIFDESHRRFSSIDGYSQFPQASSQQLSSQPKRFSSYETKSYETQKRIENGKVIYDISNSKHESQSDGDKDVQMHFPLKTSGIGASESAVHPPAPPPQQPPSREAAKPPQMDDKTNLSSTNVEEIMSALKLNSNTNTNTFSQQQQQQQQHQPRHEHQIQVELTTEAEAPTKQNPQNNNNTTTTYSYSNSQQQQEHQQKQHQQQQQSQREHIINRQQSENTTLNKNAHSNGFSSNIHNTYEEFRQRAKNAAEQEYTIPAPPSAPASTHFDHEKLFKDFDDLSKQLHIELEAANAEKARREKSASLYDLSKPQMHHREQFEQFKKQRHEHMLELEQEIEKSMKARQIRMQMERQQLQEQREREAQAAAAAGRTHDIPIHLENGNAGHYAKQNGSQYQQESVVHDIPIQRAQTPSYAPAQYEDNSRYRRAESMFNLSENGYNSSSQNGYSSSNQQQQQSHNADDWARYANDFGMSENITRPLAREVEICYNRSRPNAIRAPRLSASTNDLSNHYQHQTYDIHNAYNVRRHAPMMNKPMETEQRSRPQYLSCTSMIERNPNPTYISTTSRRGVSPAPQAQPLSPHQFDHRPMSPFCPPSNSERQQRRASLPREIHEQQLKYITSKEEELKTEFERLQNERRRLMEELQNPAAMEPPTATAAPTPPPTPKRSMRPISKLPTLSENEVFRQQMAEEWLNKVAEREERRMQKIIKISKSHEAEGYEIPIHIEQHEKPDISKEFIERVKERRHKLAMPSDSDWESGAESQPVPAGHSSESEEMPPIKIIDGRAEADLRNLPRHLREFAQFSNHQVENLENGGRREVHEEEERRQEGNDNSQSSAVKKSSMVKTIKISRLPNTPLTTGMGTAFYDSTT